jgi:hypothetical protein
VLSQPVHDHFRCPKKFIDLSLSGQLSSENGYFRFGPKATCYGHSCAPQRGLRPDSLLYDVLGDVKVEGSLLRLPFDPTEIIDNLRLERYANNPGIGNTFENLARRLYYSLRPITTLGMRERVQKFRARNWNKRAFPKWPVDTTVEDICEKILLLSMKARSVEKTPFVWFWPNGANACLTMTHDVEGVSGRNACANLMNLDDSFGIKAAFGIVPKGRYEVSATFLERIRSQGFEVAIQDLNHDGHLFDSHKEFLRRVAIINDYGRKYGAKGFRAAVLYRNQEWFEALDFSFDMSIPNVAHLDPQHGGCCTVMPYFIGNLLELPVTAIQDYTLFHVLNERSIDLWKTQIGMIVQKHGLISFIVHPDYIMEQETASVYHRLLGYLQELRESNSIWCALPSEIDSWWRARSKMSVVRDGDSWRIEGEDAQHAVLAYARNIDGILNYELLPECINH